MGVGQVLLLLLPQLILLATGLAILIGDMAAGKDTRRSWPAYVALAGLLGALLTMALLGTSRILPNAPFLGGMMALDGFGVFFSILTLTGTTLVVLASISYTRQRVAYRGEFYAFLVLVAMAMTLAVTASNLLMIFLAMEFLSITSYVLVGYLRQDAKSNEAAIKYFLYGTINSAIMLYGMSLLYGLTGSLDLEQIARPLAGGFNMAAGGRWIAFPATILMLVGFGFKIALVPFHQWSPDTYEGAPTPITAFLSVGPKAVGFAILARVFLTALPAFRPDWAALLAGISMITMTLGNLVALKQTNIKRMLAYSSIAQAGYVLIGLVAAAPGGEGAFNGINGLSIYLLAYLFTNLGAFMTVIAVEEATGSNQISDYAGLSKRAPWLAGTMLVFLLSLAGIPATGGFIGKLFVFGAAIRQQFILLAIVAIINSAIGVFYYFNVLRQMYFAPAREGARGSVGIPVGIRWVLALCLVMTVLIGLFPQPFIQWATVSQALLAAL